MDIIMFILSSSLFRESSNLNSDSFKLLIKELYSVTLPYLVSLSHINWYFLLSKLEGLFHYYLFLSLLVLRGH